MKILSKITDRQLQLLIDWSPISLVTLARLTGRPEAELVARVQDQWDRNANGGEWTERDEQARLDMVARVQTQWDRNDNNQGE